MASHPGGGYAIVLGNNCTPEILNCTTYTFSPLPPAFNVPVNQTFGTIGDAATPTSLRSTASRRRWPWPS